MDDQQPFCRTAEISEVTTHASKIMLLYYVIRLHDSLM